MRLDALTVREADGRSFWTRIGVAFPGRDGSYMVKLDAMPASNEGQYVIHLREPREKPENSRLRREGDEGYIPGFD
jgi:hypothetical protein